MPEPYQFCSLDTIVDEVHALFDEWDGDGMLAPPLDDFSLQVMKLAVHEWIANLVQHASFGGRTPEIGLAVEPNGQRVQCVIEDNSDGFDLHAQVAQQRDDVAAASPPERGRGLLMLLAYTDDLAYAPAPHAHDAPPRQRLEFWISASKRPCLDIPF